MRFAQPAPRLTMSSIACRYCGHECPPESKYCSACGGALDLPPHLMSCPRCGAINPAKAAVCIWCHAKIPGRWWRSLRGRPTRVVMITAAVAVIAVLGYRGLDWRPPGDVPRPADAGAAAPIGASIATPQAPPADRRRATVEAPSAARQPAEPQATKTLDAAAARPQATKPGRAAERASATETCTEAAAALGLCRATGGEKKAPPSAACTEAVAALGLCTSIATQRRE